MATDVEAAPVLRWVPGLIDAGFEATQAQRSKARRYLQDNRIHADGFIASAPRWGMPSWAEQWYRIDPIPGCRQARRVKVKTWTDAAGNTSAVDYRCDCQRADGTVATPASMCSHVLAVRIQRREATT